MVAALMVEATFDASAIYDLRGLHCPMPVMKIKKRLSEMTYGAMLIAETTDPLAVIDIPHFCKQYGHEFLSCDKVEGGHRFTIINGG
jgi:tRNA 2-thiouridine synthesizing protein A